MKKPLFVRSNIVKYTSIQVVKHKESENHGIDGSTNLIENISKEQQKKINMTTDERRGKSCYN